MEKRGRKVERYAASLSWQVLAENLKSRVRKREEALKTAGQVMTSLIYFIYSPNIIRVCKQVNGEGGGWRRFRQHASKNC